MRFKFECNFAYQTGLLKRYSLIDDLTQDCIDRLTFQEFNNDIDGSLRHPRFSAPH